MEYRDNAESPERLPPFHPLMWWINNRSEARGKDAMEDVQYLLGHADARTTKLYDRRKRQITRNLVERISV
jgi:integrase